jgi:hypothetical protein
MVVRAALIDKPQSPEKSSEETMSFLRKWSLSSRTATVV